MIEQVAPFALILLGPPGSGKGTHAIPLSRHLSVPHISTGELFREHMRRETAMGKLARSFIDQGKLVPDALVLDMLFERVQLPDCTQGYILDGFPRTLAQAESFDERIKNQTWLTVLNLDIPDALLIERIVARRGCNNCGRLYNLKFAPPRNFDRCDECATTLMHREDDKEEIIAKRLEVYHAQKRYRFNDLNMKVLSCKSC